MPAVRQRSQGILLGELLQFVGTPQNVASEILVLGTALRLSRSKGGRHLIESTRQFVEFSDAAARHPGPHVAVCRARAVARNILRTGISTLRTVATEIAVRNKITIAVTMAITLRLLRSASRGAASSSASPGAAPSAAVAVAVAVAGGRGGARRQLVAPAALRAMVMRRSGLRQSRRPPCGSEQRVGLGSCRNSSSFRTLSAFRVVRSPTMRVEVFAQAFDPPRPIGPFEVLAMDSRLAAKAFSLAARRSMSRGADGVAEQQSLRVLPDRVEIGAQLQQRLPSDHAGQISSRRHRATSESAHRSLRSVGSARRAPIGARSATLTSTRPRSRNCATERETAAVCAVPADFHQRVGAERNSVSGGRGADLGAELACSFQTCPTARVSSSVFFLRDAAAGAAAGWSIAPAMLQDSVPGDPRACSCECE